MKNAPSKMEATPRAGQRMLLWLSEAIVAARTAAQVRIEAVAAKADVSAARLYRFERGETWPKPSDLDRIIAAYAELAGLEGGLAVWQLALNLWREHGIAPMRGQRDDDRANRTLELLHDQLRRQATPRPQQASAETSSASKRQRASR